MVCSVKNKTILDNIQPSELLKTLQSMEHLFYGTPYWLHCETSSHSKTIHTHISTNVYSQVLIHTAEWTGAMKTKTNLPKFDMTAQDLYPGSESRVPTLAIVPAAPLRRCATAPLGHCATAPLHHCATGPLRH